MVKSARAPVQAEAIIIRVSDYGDTNRIIEVLTPTLGRLSLVARGGRASRRRFSGMLDLFVTLRAQCRSAPGLWTLVAADLVHSRLSLRTSIEVFSRACMLCEAVRVLAPEGESSEDLYSVLQWGLDRLDEGELGQAALVYPRLLKTAGLMPVVDECAACGARALHRGALIAQMNGVLCERCAPNELLLPVELLAGVIPTEPVAKLSASVLESSAAEWIEAQTDRRLRSRAMLYPTGTRQPRI